MASKVNVKFVSLLGGLLLLVVGIVGYLTYRSLRSSPAELFAAGERAAAAGDWEKAVRSYGNAVNKEQTNTEYLRKWIDAIGHSKPASIDLYKERYGLLLNGLRKLGDNVKNDVAAHKQLLDLQLNDVRGGAGQAAGDAFIRETERVLGYFAENDPQRAGILRYRGAGRVLVMTLGGLSDEKDREAARQDLLAAIQFNPADDLAVMFLADWYYVMADAARRAGEPEKATALVNEAAEKVGALINAHPPCAPALLSLRRMQINEAYVRDQGKSTPAQMATAQQKHAQEIIEAFRKSDPKTVDETLIPAAISLAVATGMDNAQAEGDKIIETLLAARPNNPLILAEYAEVARLGARHRETIDRYQKIVDMPDLPVSTDGMILFRLRDIALQRQFEAALGIWESSAADKKPAALAEARALREKIRTRLGDNDPKVSLADAKLAFVADDLVTSRQLLTKYMQSEPNDTGAMLLLAQVLIRQNQLGAARQQLERLVELRTANPGVYAALADIEGQMRNYDNAAKALEMAIRLDPSNPVLQDKYVKARNLAAGEQAANPIIRALTKAQRMMNQAELDFEGALKELKAVIDTETDRPDDLMALAQGFAQLGDKDNAIKILDRAIAKWPDQKAFAQAKESLNTTVPIADRLIDSIRNNPNLDDFTKTVQCALAYRRLNQPEKAAAELDKARTLKPDDPIILGYDFDAALSRRDFETAKKLADKGAAVNADKVGGLMFRAQLEYAQGRLADAAALVQQATDRDPLNATAWRMLGEIRLQMRQTAEGIDALQHARRIKPDDLPSLTALIRAKMSAGLPQEALALAREGVLFSGDDPTFFNLWCSLEFDYGDQVKAIERRLRAFQINPKDRTNALDLARMMIRRRSFDAASTVIKHLEEGEVVETMTIAMKAVVLAAKGDKEAAFKLFQQMVEAIPAEKRKGEEHIYFARYFAENGLMDLATQTLEAGRQYQDPKYMSLERELGDMMFASTQYEKAIAAYQRVRDAGGEDKDDALLKRMVETLNRLGKFAESTALLDSAKARENGDTQLLLLRAQVLMGTNAKDAARKSLDRAIELKPDLASAYYMRGQLGIDDPAVSRDAQADLEQCLRLDPNLIMARRTLFRHFFRNGQSDRAFSIMRDGVNLNPDNGSLRIELGQLMVANGASEEALRLYQEGIRRQSKEVAWYILCGQIYEPRRDFARAVEMYAKAWAIDKNAAVAVSYCNALLSTNPPDTNKVMEILDEPKLEVAKQWPLLLVKARTLILQSKQADAEKEITAAFALVKQDELSTVGSFVRTLVSIYSNPRANPPERPADALAMMRRLAPTSGHSETMRLAMARLQAGLPAQRDAGVVELRALMTATNKEVALEATKGLAGLAYVENRFAEAADLYAKALPLSDKDPEVLNNLAFTLSDKLNRPADALPHAEKAAALLPNNASVLDTLGAIHLALQHYDQCEKTLGQAVAAAGNPMEKAMPVYHTILLRLARGDRTGADQLKRELDLMIEQDPRIAERYKTDLDSLRTRLDSRN